MATGGGGSPATFAAWVAEQLGPLVGGDGRVGVWVATPDAGASAAVELWREALDVGPAFAMPQVFPWTLASSLGAHIARVHRLRGPNTTLIGDDDAEVAALALAHASLAEGEVDRALVACIRVHAGELFAVVLVPGGGQPPRDMGIRELIAQQPFLSED